MRVVMTHRLVTRLPLSLSLSPLSGLVEEATDDDYDDDESHEDAYEPASSAAWQSGSSNEVHQVGRNQKQSRGIKAMIMTLSQGQILDATTRVLWLYVLEGIVPKTARRFEWASAVVPPLVTLCSKAMGFPVQKVLPRPLSCIIGCLAHFSVPAAVMIGFGLIGKIAHTRRASRQASQTNGSPVPNSSSANPEPATNLTPADMVRIAREQKPQLAREHLEVFSPSIMKLRALVDWDLLESVSDMAQRFQSSNCELMRFGAQGGLLEATSDAMVDDCLEATVNNLSRTAKWVQSFSFMNVREVRACWSHLVPWTLRLPDGHPVLLVRLGEAMNECSGKKSEEFCRAVITQINRGVLKLLKDDDIDQLVVVVDCQGARSLQITKYLRLIRRMPAILNQHYPGRLKSIHFANLPTVLRWVIQAIKPVVHPATRQKFVLHESTEEMDPSLLEVLNWGRTTDDFTKFEARTSFSVSRDAGPSPFATEGPSDESGKMPQKVAIVSQLCSESPRTFAREQLHTAGPSLLPKNMTEVSLVVFLIAASILTIVIMINLKHMGLKVIEKDVADIFFSGIKL